MTVLTHTASATLGRQRYDVQIADVQADLSLLPGVNYVRVRLPHPVPLDAGVGDDAVVAIAAEGSAMPILSGTIAQIRRTVDGIDVIAIDGGGQVAALRPAATFEAQSLSDIARSIVSDAGATMGRSDGIMRLAYYVADQSRTGAEHVARLAGFGGLIAHVTSAGSIEMITRPLGLATKALLYGREFATYSVCDSAGPLGTPVAVGNGAGVFVPAPNGLQHATSPLTAGAPTVGTNAVWRPTPALRTPDVVAAANLGHKATRAAHQQRLVANCWLQPQLRPADLVQIQGTPDRLPAGPWMITNVMHRLTRDGGETRVEAVTGGASITNALSALGGLL